MPELSGPLEIVHLKVFSTTFTITCSSDEDAGLLRQLWQSFLVRSGRSSLDLLLDRRAGRWLLESWDGNQVANTVIWPVLQQLRGLLSQQALKEARGIVAVHSSVVSRGSDGLLLAGPAFAGKTTLAIELMNRGWAFHSDDLGAVEEASGRLIPFPKPVQVRDVSEWDRLSPAWSPPMWLEPSDEWLAPPRAFQRVQNQAVSPRWVLFPTYDPSSDGELVPLPPALGTALCLQNLQNPGLALAVASETFSKMCGSASLAKVSYPSTAEAMRRIEKWVASTP